MVLVITSFIETGLIVDARLPSRSSLADEEEVRGLILRFSTKPTGDLEHPRLWIRTSDLLLFSTQIPNLALVAAPVHVPPELNHYRISGQLPSDDSRATRPGRDSPPIGSVRTFDLFGRWTLDALVGGHLTLCWIYRVCGELLVRASNWEALVLGHWRSLSLFMGGPCPWSWEVLVLGHGRSLSLFIGGPCPWSLEVLVLGHWRSLSLVIGGPCPWSLEVLVLGHGRSLSLVIGSPCPCSLEVLVLGHGRSLSLVMGGPFPWSWEVLVLGHGRSLSLFMGSPYPWSLEVLVLGHWRSFSLVMGGPCPWSLEVLVLGHWRPLSLVIEGADKHLRKSRPGIQTDPVENLRAGPDWEMREGRNRFALLVLSLE
ncbi:hypothetical protein EGW08_008205 [Elysia chlorotica]|uniref:Uncharacterized protein n=1 Tax=Elysia chlorotica TaxID=188477 RepID=A0A433TR44_ELYCH|nr:hypothetical protein EGW08_008205 [Elysia chlorotica]